MALALYMDHHVPRAITNGLRLRNIEVITAYEDSDGPAADDSITLYRLSTHAKRHGVRGDFMKKKADIVQDDELRPEYDFTRIPGGVKGKYVERYRAGTNLALLDPEVAAAFPTDEAVNEALRLLMKVAKTQVSPSS